MERDDIISAFENLNRNRYFKLFDYYQAWFVDKDYLSSEISRKIKTELGIEVNEISIQYVRSKIMPKRLAEKAKLMSSIVLKKDVINASKVNDNFEFNEPQSIDFNQEIVTFRKSKI